MITTIISCIVIVGFTIFYAYSLWNLYKFTDYLRKNDDDKIENILSNNKINNIKDLYNKYRENISEINSKECTHEYAEDYFSEENVLRALIINKRQISSASGVLVGLGLLGTFLGLTLGVMSFNADSSEAIQNSIQLLLSGMTTAFLTSLLGMTFSIIFIFFEKYLMNEFSKQVNRICSVLNKKYYLSDNEFYASYLSFKDEHGNIVPISNAVRDIYADTQKHTELITHIINELSYKNEEGNVVPIGNAVRDIYANTQKQTALMDSLVGDLSDALDEKLSSNINDKVVPLIDNFVKVMGEKLDMLKASMQSPAEDMTRSVVSELKASMQEMMEKFGADLSGSATSNLTQLTDNLAQASSALTDLPAQMNAMTEQLGTAFGGIHNTITDLETAVKNIVEQSTNSNSNLIEEAASQYRKMEASHHQISSQTDVLIANFNNMVETLNTTVKEVQSSMVQIKETKNALNSLVVSLQSITSNMNQASTRFSNSQQNYMSGIKEVQDKSSSTVTHITQALQLSKDSLDDYSRKFSTIQQGLSGVFEQLNKGLNQYSTTVNQSTQEALDGYSSALNDSIKNLKNAIGGLGDLIEDINDTIKNIKGVK